MVQEHRSVYRGVRNLGDGSAGRWCGLRGSSWYDSPAGRSSSLVRRFALSLGVPAFAQAASTPAAAAGASAGATSAAGAASAAGNGTGGGGG
eukprot:scaffold44884_cov60-Phaeocystis_antarctica.AAC.1